MSFLRSFLIILFVVIALYTVIVISREGMGLIPVFFGDLVALTWRGQFNLDFACYLMGSALWVAWRGGFSGGAVATALVASVAGMLFFAPLVLVYLARAEGDLRKLLLGVHAEA